MCVCVCGTSQVLRDCKYFIKRYGGPMRNATLPKDHVLLLVKVCVHACMRIRTLKYAAH